MAVTYAKGTATVTADGTVTKDGLAEDLYDAFVEIGQAIGASIVPTYSGIPEGPTGYRTKLSLCSAATKIAAKLMPGGWEDITVSSLAARGGASAPAFAAFVGGIYREQYAAAGPIDEKHGEFHVRHDYQLGTPFYLHAHWSPTTANAGDVVWAVEWSCARPNLDSYSATTTTSLPAHAAGGNIRKHLLIEDPVGVTDATFETDAIMIFRVYRDTANVADTYPDAAVLHTADLHIATDHRTTTDKTRGSGWVPGP